MVNYSIK